MPYPCAAGREICRMYHALPGEIVAKIVIQPEDKFRLGDFLIQSLSNADWTEFRGAVAFAKRSGTKHVRQALQEFSKRGSVNLSVGISSGGTSAEGLEDLMAAVLPTGKLWIFHNPSGSTFHPKVFLFKNANAVDLIVGSGNLTEGGLFTNYEAGVRLALDRSNPGDQEVLKGIESALDRWSKFETGRCLPLDTTLLGKLIDSGLVPIEALAKETEEGSSEAKSRRKGPDGTLFRATGVQAAPKAAAVGAKQARAKGGAKSKSSAAHASGGSKSGGTVPAGQSFLMTLQRTDVGFGQTSAGAAQRSPEIFIPMRAVDLNPQFWDWPIAYKVDKKWASKHAAAIAKKAKNRRTLRPLEKVDREKVRVLVSGTNHPVEATIWFNPEKVDLRIRNKELRAAGNVGDILVLTKAKAGGSFDYSFDVITPVDARFPALSAACGHSAAKNSKKRFGYI
jgi:HKD family nuclease